MRIVPRLDTHGIFRFNVLCLSTGPFRNNRIWLSPKQKQPRAERIESKSARRAHSTESKKGSFKRGESRATGIAPKRETLEERPQSSFDLFRQISSGIHVAFEKLVPPNANIHVYVALSASALDVLVPTVFVRKGLDTYCTHIVSSPISIVRTGQCEEFISLALSRLQSWLHSQRLPGRESDQSLVTQVNPQSDYFVTTAHPGNGTLFGRGSQEEDADRVNFARGLRVAVPAEGLKSAAESDLTTRAHREAAGFAHNKLRESDTDEVPTAGAASSLVSHLNPVTLHVLNGRYPSNLFYFRGENIQSIQNKRSAVLYKQVRHLQQALGSSDSTGFVSIKIFPWSQYYKHFPELLRGHTIEALFASESGRWTSSGYEKLSEGDVKMMDITKSAPHRLDPDAFFVSVELFTGDVIEAGQLARNAHYPPLNIPKPEALTRSSTLPESEGAKHDSRIRCSDDEPLSTVSIVDSTRMWSSTNRRFFVRFADAEHGPIGVLREMLGNLLEAFDLGTHQSFAEEAHLCRKLDSNLHNHQPKNFAEIVSRHYLGQTVTVDSSFMPSQAYYAADIKVSLCGNYTLDHDGNPLTTRRATDDAPDSTSSSLCWDPTMSDLSVGLAFNGGRTPQESLDDLGLDNVFSPLSGFPAVTIGRGIGKSKKEAVDPGLIMHLKRNFFNEVGVSYDRGSKLIASEGIGGYAHAVLASRLRSLFAGPPSILNVRDGCIASRFLRVVLSNEAKVDNTDFLTDLWRPLLEHIHAREQCLIGNNFGGESVSLCGPAATEEEAIQSLREALARCPQYRGIGFSLHSTVSSECLDEIESETISQTVWFSEVVVNNRERTVLGSAKAFKKRLSKHEAVLAALYTLSPEAALRIKGQQASTLTTSDINSMSAGDGGHVETSDHFRDDDASLSDVEEFDPVSDVLLGHDKLTSSAPDLVSSEASSNDCGSFAPGGEDCWSCPTEKHTYHPSTSAVSQYRRALQMQIEILMDYAQCSNPPDRLIDGGRDAYWLSLQPLRSIYELVQHGGIGPDELTLKEVIDVSDQRDPEPNYICSLYAERCGEGDERILLAKSQPFVSPILARLNALSTAFHFLVRDPSLVEEARSRIGGGVLPRLSISAPSLSAFGDVCLFYVGSRATVVRTGVSSKCGDEITHARVIVPSAMSTTRTESDSSSQCLVLSTACHSDASNAERIAILAALKALQEASQPSGYVARLARNNSPVVAPPPPVLFSVVIGPNAKGFLAKALTLLLSEAQHLRLLGESLGVGSVTLVMRGFADPARLRMLWDDRIWGSGTASGPNPVRNIQVLDDTIRALHSCVVSHSTSQSAMPSLVASEAASDIQKTLSVTAPISISLHVYDPYSSAREDIKMETLPRIPVPVAASEPCTGVLAAIDGLISSLIQRIGNDFVLNGGDISGKIACCDLLTKKVTALRIECLHTVDTRAASMPVSEVQELPNANAEETLSTAMVSTPPIVKASKSLLGSRKDFNRTKHFKYEHYLDRFVLMVFGKQMDVFYSRPSAGVRSAQQSSYESSTTHIAPLGESLDSSKKDSVIHNWYCVLGVEVFSEEDRCLLSGPLSTFGSSNSTHPIQRRIVTFAEDLSSPLEECFAIGSLERAPQDFFHTLSSHSSNSLLTTDTDSIRRGFGGTIKDVRPGFIVVGFGSGETKKDAHAAAARHALRWHFPERMEELSRRGVCW